MNTGTLSRHNVMQHVTASTWIEKYLLLNNLTYTTGKLALLLEAKSLIDRCRVLGFAIVSFTFCILLHVLCRAKHCIWDSAAKYSGMR
jgi:hypothetical protein